MQVDPTQTPAQQRVEIVVKALLRAIDHGDTQALEGVWAATPSMFFPFLNTPQLAVGKAAIVRRFGALFDKFARSGAAPPYFGFVLNALHVDFNGDTAICTLTYPVKKSLARRTMILILEQGEWRIKHVHGSNAAIDP